MKRLLAAGYGPVYQVCKVFRDGESGRLHNPEFTMLEWYRPGFDAAALMDEVEALVRCVVEELRALGSTETIPYREAFRRHAGVDPFKASVAELRQSARQLGIEPSAAWERESRDFWLQLLLTHTVEPRLGQGELCFLTDYPASQAALARIRDGDPPFAERFELYWRGVELANGFHELADPEEQRQRFEHDRAVRHAARRPDVPMDERLLAALASGLPDCSGVALGIDRLLMLAVGADALSEVLSFPVSRA